MTLNATIKAKMAILWLVWLWNWMHDPEKEWDTYSMSLQELSSGNPTIEVKMATYYPSDLEIGRMIYKKHRATLYTDMWI